MAVAVAIAGALAVSAVCSWAAVSHVPPTYATLNEWITQDAIRFSVESTPSLNDAVDKVLASLGDSVELLGFGEALHGGEDILRLRNRFFKRLVEAHGYTAIAIETGYDEAYAVNEYVAGHGPATYETLLDSGYGRAFGRLEANRDLVDWMRQYNSDESRPLKLQFYGFDISIGATRIAGPHRVLRLALDYLSAIDSASGQEHRQQIDSLLAEASGWDEAWTDPTKAPALKPVGTALRVATEDLITELRVRRPELVAKSNEGRYLDALQYALVARQMLNFHAAVARTTGEPPAGTGLRGVRDALMADNLAYIVAREQGRGKVMVFAHNEHLQRGKSVWPCCGQKFKGTDVYAWWPAGSQLNDMFGRRYAVIGSALGVSDDVNGLGQPEAGSLEARLTVVPGLALFIPTHRGQGLPAAEIATLKPRSGSSKNLSYTALDSQSLTNFDWLQVLGSTGYALQLPGGTIR